ncbi:MAG: 16S rRNA (cytosine(967)-C(5))-methyltransferase RsmB [Deltaproteobacteria bacterium]|nr:16S rRNA (cytosine(967)-C(5))-methyltransferase RsmB [Deltaproteobacteria bacterium]
MGNPRKIALDILKRVEAGSAYPDILLDKWFKKVELSTQDRAFTTSLVYGTLRWKGRIDWVIDQFSRVKTKKLEHKILLALRLGVYQLLFTDKVPPSAAVDESVKLVKPLGKEKGNFVNAILRRVDRERANISFPELGKDPILHISIFWSHPAWMVKRWVGRYGVEETIRLCQSNNEIPPQVLRVNTLKVTRDELLERLRKEGLEVRPTRFSPDGIEIVEGHLPTSYYIQDEASQLISYLVDPRPCEVIVDACAAPGGKATHLAQLMKNNGVIYAMDIYPARVNIIKETCKRLDTTIVKPVVGNATKGLTFAPKDGFDAILADAPCSGLGVLRRNPDIKWKRKEGDIKRLSQLQKDILSNLAGYVKKGGRIVYSACTLELEENEEVVNDFLERHKDFVVEDAGQLLPNQCHGIVDKKALRTFPPRDGMDGFFAVRLKRCL